MQQKKSTRSRLRFFPLVTLSAFFLPVLLGLAGTWLPAFGYLPVIDHSDFVVRWFKELFNHPSFSGSLRATLISGLGATACALSCTVLIVISCYGTRFWCWLIRFLSPFLAVPHAAFAIGFCFLIAPSGLIIRALSPELTGFTAPPDWLIIKDPLGLSLMFGLVFKEIPFLLLMCISGLNQLDVRRTIWVGRSLGYANSRIWTRLILPQLYPQLRLPVFAVLAYSLSVVDMAIVLGPSVPPTFAVLVDRWFNDPDLSYRLIGAAGATLLLIVVAVTILLCLVTERVLFTVLQKRIIDGSRVGLLEPFYRIGRTLSFIWLLVSGLCLTVLLLWSFAKWYRFPDLLPASFTLKFWLKGFGYAGDPLLVTFLIAAAATVIATVLVIGCLEYEVRLKQQGQLGDRNKMMWLVCLPLLVPQIAFLFGIQIVITLIHAEGRWFSMVGIHLVFVLPYVFLTLSGVYRSYDERFTQVAVFLSGSPLKSFFQIKLPMLTKPVLFTMATGFAVSVAQYLPTMYVGAGRFMTITTETVSLVSGSDRRVLAVYALCQFLLPLLVYAFSLLLPSWIFRDRKGMAN